MFYLVGIIITFFLSFLLISKKGKADADKYLAVWLLAIGTHLTLFYLYFTNKHFDFPYLLGVIIPFPLIHGPFLYFYTASLTKQIPKKKSIIFLHLIPFFITYPFLIPFFTLPNEDKIFVYQNKGLGFETLSGIILVAIIISGISYVTLSLLVLRKHTKTTYNEFSYIEKINLNWLRYLIAGISIIWVSVMCGNDNTTFSSVVAFVLFIGYFGIKQVGIFTNTHPSTENTDTATANFIIQGQGDPEPDVQRKFNTPEPEGTIVEGQQASTQAAPGKVKYQKSSLSDSLAVSIHQEMKHLMETEKTFKDAELSLSQLAQKLRVHPNSLSQVINTYENRNFYDYINGQRIEEFKRIVTNPKNQKYTLLSLAFDCGYNSKTSFNRNFKKVTGVSPSVFLKNANIHLK